MEDDGGRNASICEHLFYSKHRSIVSCVYLALVSWPQLFHVFIIRIQLLQLPIRVMGIVLMIIELETFEIA